MEILCGNQLYVSTSGKNSPTGGRCQRMVSESSATLRSKAMTQNHISPNHMILELTPFTVRQKAGPAHNSILKKHKTV